MTSLIHVIHTTNMWYPFGSVYYTKMGTTITNRSAPTVMTLSDRAVQLLKNAVKTNSFWYKPSNLKKNVVQEEYEELIE